MKAPVKTIIVTNWIFALLFAVPLLASGVAYVLTAPPIVEGMAHLGYPFYFIRFLGIAKILGAVAILVGIFPKIKEWAYAGFAFNLIGAAYSHLCSGDGPKAFVPLVILVLGVFSYSYWHKLAFLKTAELKSQSLPIGLRQSTTRNYNH